MNYDVCLPADGMCRGGFLGLERLWSGMKRVVLCLVAVICSLSVFSATDDYNARQAKRYTQEAEYYQKKADGYRREAQYYLKKAEGYQREAAYYTRKGTLTGRRIIPGVPTVLLTTIRPRCATPPTPRRKPPTI